MTSVPNPTPPAAGLAGLSLPDGVALLSGADSNWGMIRVQGADATRFLQAQLTHDFALLQPDQARLAAFCNAKGRMQASFVALRTAQDAEGASYLLVCRKDLLATVLKRLRMFVLRSKVTLEEVGEGLSLYGLLGEAAETAWGEGATGAQPWNYRYHDGRHLVWLYPAAEPDARLPRALCVQASELPAPAGAPLDASLWELAEVRSGVTTVSQASYEAFVPQMVNYESVGGVNFKKGCYPGQEVVARSQFRGAIKRRAHPAVGALAAGAALPQAGQDVWRIASDGGEPEPCGVIAQVAPMDGGFALLASLQNSCADDAVQGRATLRAGAADGPELQLQPLPYALLEDI